MLCRARIKFLSHGKHNNLHFAMKIGGSRRIPLFIIKMVMFFSDNSVYVSHSGINPELAAIIDLQKLQDIIQLELDQYDYVLQPLVEQDLFKKRLNTNYILKNKNKNEQKA